VGGARSGGDDDRRVGVIDARHGVGAPDVQAGSQGIQDLAVAAGEEDIASPEGTSANDALEREPSDIGAVLVLDDGVEFVGQIASFTDTELASRGVAAVCGGKALTWTLPCRRPEPVENVVCALRRPAAVVEVDYVVVVVGWRRLDSVVGRDRRDRIALDAVNPRGAKVDWNVTSDRVRPNASPDAASGLEHDHVGEAVGAQFRRGGQTCNTSADDDHPFMVGRVRLDAAKAEARDCGGGAESDGSQPMSQDNATA